jgi:hypothetical protein
MTKTEAFKIAEKYRISAIVTLLLLPAFLMLSCAPAKVTYTENEISLHQKRWLSKAYRYDKDGWIFVHIEGEPFERGFQRGYLTADETDKMFKTLTYVTEFGTGRDIDFFVSESEKLFKGKISPEYVEEMQGMAAGVRAAGKETTYEQILFMNGFIDIMWYWYPTVEDKLPDDEPGCSAFIATGDATTDGRIVMAHNSWAGYTTIQFCNIAVEIVPDKGNRILMQSWGPAIYSMTDFFITSAGLVGTETTIGGFDGFNAKGKPVFERARKAMQYACSIDEWANMMIEDNSGAYANSWLIGDVNTGEIACLELGLKFHSLQKKINGYFTGSNVAEDVKILRRETRATYDDLRNSAVARRVRWEQLMKKYYGKIDVVTAKKMLADHYDVYLKKENPSSRTICGHWELEDGSIPASGGPWRPSGTIDGKVVDSQMAKSRQFWARWGSSCGRTFDANDFLAEHPQYNRLKGFLPNLPAQPWTILPMKK